MNLEMTKIKQDLQEAFILAAPSAEVWFWSWAHQFQMQPSPATSSSAGFRLFKPHFLFIKWDNNIGWIVGAMQGNPLGNLYLNVGNSLIIK